MRTFKHEPSNSGNTELFEKEIVEAYKEASAIDGGFDPRTTNVIYLDIASEKKEG